MANHTFYTYYDSEGKGINPAHISDYKTSIIFDAYNRTIYAQEGQYGNHYVGTYNGERFVSYHGETFNDFNHNNAYGDYSSAFGTYTTAYNKGEAAFGYHNLSTYNKSLFTIGYGTAENPANIIDVHNNGNTYINNFNISRAIPHLVQTTLEFGRYYIWVGDETELPASDERFENVIYFVSDDKPTTGLIYPEDDYRQQYLTFVPLSNSTFSFSGNNIQYKIDDDNWTTLTAGSNTPEVVAGSKISWRGNLTVTDNGIGKFTSTANFDVMGNIMSLLYGDDFIDNTEISNNAFKQLFENCQYLVNAKHLYLPSKTLANYCYCAMFNGCTGLTTAPKLPATTLEESCYAYMFQHCTSLTTAPTLPATILAKSCYAYMFNGCTSLTAAPALPAKTLADNCYDTMFYGCSELTVAPELPATTLIDNCYDSMFSGCTGLVAAPALPAEILAQECYSNMFSGCTGLVAAPELPATTLAPACYSGMFNSCTSLTTAPELPATTLAPECYHSMFKGCTGLTAAPYLPATTLITGCYSQMFNSCTYLNEIRAEFKTTPGTTYTSNWVNRVADSGIFYKNTEAEWENSYGPSYIPTNWTVISKDEPQIDEDDEIANQCLMLYNKDEHSFSELHIYIPQNMQNTIKKIAYSYGKDGDNWNWTVITNTQSGTNLTININPNKTVYILMKGNGTAINNNTYARIGCEYQEYTLSGNIMALACGPDWKPKQNIENNYQFYGLFNSEENENMTIEINVDPNYKGLLPAETLKPYCYGKMFQGCTSITAAPALPASELVSNCYREMFSGCSSLSSIKANFTTEPGPAYTYDWVADVAYPGTFYNDNVTYWSQPLRYGSSYIPKTNAEPWAVNDEGITYITTTVSQSQGVDNSSISFYIPTGFPKDNSWGSGYITEVQYSTDGGSNWTKYTHTDTDSAHEITVQGPDSQREVYWRIKGGGTGTATSYCYFNCDTNHTFEVGGNVMSLACDNNWKPRVDIENNYQFAGLFKNSRITSCDKEFLPALKLENGCYQSMFYNCKQLTSAPKLPAGSLIDERTLNQDYFIDCYKDMFNGCSSLKEITALFTSMPYVPGKYENKPYPCTSDWVFGVAYDNTCKFTYTGDWVEQMLSISTYSGKLYSSSLIPLDNAQKWNAVKENQSTSTGSNTGNNNYTEGGDDGSGSGSGSTPGGGGDNGSTTGGDNEDPNDGGVSYDDPNEGGGINKDKGETDTGETNTDDTTENLPSENSYFDCPSCGEQITEYPCTYCGYEGEQIEEAQEEAPDDEQVNDVLYELTFYLDGETIKMNSECSPSSVDTADVYYLLNDDDTTYKVTDTLEHFANGVTINNIYDISSVYVERRSVETPGVLYEATWSIKAQEENTP